LEEFSYLKGHPTLLPMQNGQSPVPDTRMNFVGLRSKQDRDDVIAYLQQATP
jgi:cytochrome c2